MGNKKSKPNAVQLELLPDYDDSEFELIDTSQNFAKNYERTSKYQYMDRIIAAIVKGAMRDAVNDPTGRKKQNPSAKHWLMGQECEGLLYYLGWPQECVLDWIDNGCKPWTRGGSIISEGN